MARVLIVEDEMIIARDLEAILMRMGHEVAEIATNANAAMLAAEGEDIDLALLDIVLRGDRDGVTLAAHLREEYPMRIIFLTSHADSETVRRASAVKPDGYLLKPFTEESLFASLSVALAYEEAQHSVDLEMLSEESTAWTKLPASVFEKVEEHVSRHMDRDVKLSDLARIAHMSESSFSRRFKATTGTTPYQYVLIQRLDEAKRLLRNTDWPLVEVAVAVGFSSQSHFATAFKKTIGVTPLAYRRL